MIQRFVAVLLIFVFVGCGGDGEISSVEELSENSPELIVWKKDGKVMKKVTVIEDYTELGNPIYRYYYADAEYVSVGQYKVFIEASGFRPKEKMNWENIYKKAPTDDDPMTNLSWNEVQAYVKWVGKKLPKGKGYEWYEGTYNKKVLDAEKKVFKAYEQDSWGWDWDWETSWGGWWEQRYGSNPLDSPDERCNLRSLRCMVDVPKSKIVQTNKGN